MTSQLYGKSKSILAKDFSTLSEKQLISSSKKGECAAFEELISRNKRIIHSSITSKFNFSSLKFISHGAYDEEDIFNVAIHKAWKYIKNFKGNCKFSTWCIRIAINEIHDNARKSLRRPSQSLEKIEEDLGDGGLLESCGQVENEALKNISFRDLQKTYEEALSKLKKDKRIAIDLFVREDLTYGEISKACCIPIGTVMSRIYYARKKLIKEMTLLLKNR